MYKNTPYGDMVPSLMGKGKTTNIMDQYETDQTTDLELYNHPALVARTNQWQSTYEQYGGVAEERDRSILPLIASNDRARKKIPCTNSDYGNFYKMDVDHGKRKYSVERFPYLPPIGDGTITYTPRHNPKQPLSSLDQPLSSRYYDDHNSINLSGIENVDMEIVCHDHTAVNLRSSRDNGYSYTSYPHVSNVHVPDIKDIVLKIKQRDGSVVQVVTSPK